MSSNHKVLSAFVAVAVLASFSIRAQDEEFKRSYADSIGYEKALDYDTAIKYMLAIRATTANSYAINYRLGWLYYASGKYADSRVAYQSAIRLNPQSLEAKLGYISTLLALGRWDEAEFVAKQIIKADVNNYYANLRLSYALRMQKKASVAEKLANDMLSIYPSDVNFMVELAFAFLGQNNPAAARKIFGDILMYSPDNYWAKEQIGKL